MCNCNRLKRSPTTFSCVSTFSLPRPFLKPFLGSRHLFSRPFLTTLRNLTKPYETFETLRNVTKPFTNLSKPFKTFQNLSKPFKTLQNLTKPFKTFQNLSKPFKTFQNLSKPFKTFQNLSSPKSFYPNIPIKGCIVQLNYLFLQTTLPPTQPRRRQLGRRGT